MDISVRIGKLHLNPETKQLLIENQNELSVFLVDSEIPEYMQWNLYKQYLHYFARKESFFPKIQCLCHRIKDFPEALFFAKALSYLYLERRTQKNIGKMKFGNKTKKF